MIRRDFLKVAMASAFAGFATSNAWAGNGVLRLVICPGTGLYDAPVDLLTSAYDPLKNYLEKELRRTVSVRITRSVEDLGRSVFVNADLLLLPPTAAIGLAQGGSFHLLARSSAEAVGSLVSVRPEIKSVQSLQAPSGLRYASAMKGSWLERMSAATLASKKANISNTTYFNAQDDVFQWLARGNADIGSLRGEAVSAFVAQGGYIVTQLPATPDYTLLASNRIDVATRNRMRELAFGMPVGVLAALQQGIHVGIPRFVEARPGEYRTIAAALKV